MDAQTIRETYDLFPLVAQHTRLRKVGPTWHVGPCPFCGGTDRFTLKDTANGWRWFCRQCGDGRYHDAIDFMMTLHNIDFKTALKELGGEVKAPSNVAHPRPTVPTEKKYEMPTDVWQHTGLRFVTEKAQKLQTNPVAEMARKYLLSRGIHPGMWDAFQLGYTVDHQRPAIVIPWMDVEGVDEMLFAVKYRYMDQGDPRYSAMPGSKPLLFGLQRVRDIDKVLILVEGEFNAISISQCEPSNVSVVSIGAKNLRYPAVLKRLADRFEQVDVWTDDVEDARSIIKELGHKNAHALRSPVWDGVKYDANELLKVGQLGDFLTERYNVPLFGKVLADVGE